MAGRHPHQSTRVAEVAELFRRAVTALDRRTAGGRAAALRESARCLADAFLAARGHGPGTDADRAGLLSSEPIVDHETDRALIDLLRLDPRGDRAGSPELERLEQQYRALLPRYRSALAGETPGYGRALQCLKNAAGQRWIQGAAAGVATAAVLSAAAYQLTEPAYTLEVSGQLFWKSAAGEPFAEERSRKFKVSVDGEPHQYIIMLDESVRLSALRLDPVDSAAVTSVAIRRVGILDGAGQEYAELHDPAAWTCVNCRWLSGAGHGGRLRPDGDDPYVIPPPVDPVEMSGIRLVMSAAAEKSFWEWATRLEKNN